jgi:murein DD-endopeptidase MepM/ murein hydrolase activator NlpD
MTPDTFGVAHAQAVGVVNYQPGGPLGAGASDLQFGAEGYAVSGGLSSYPFVMDITGTSEFAVHTADKDFYDPEALFLAWEFQKTGVDKPSAVRWPHVSGQRNGSEFWFSCPLPSIGRDLIDECSGVANTYYKFPFEGGAPDWALAQGNNGTFTHNGFGRFAFDFTAAQGTSILAARRGEVLAITDENSGSCFCAKPTCDPAACISCTTPNANNNLSVLHEDGTVANYKHFTQNGATVSEGDFVHRGDELAVVGNTGCSTTSHLHFEVQSADAQSTIQITFDSAVAGSETCYLPNKGDPIESTNVQNP